MFGEDKMKKEMGIPEPMVLGAGVRSRIPIKENIANVSGFEKFFLGDPEKKAAKNAKTIADAEFTTSLATLMAQMTAEQNANKQGSSGNTTMVVVIAGLVLVGVFVTAAVLINKKNKAAMVATPPVS